MKQFVPLFEEYSQSDSQIFVIDFDDTPYAVCQSESDAEDLILQLGEIVHGEEAADIASERAYDRDAFIKAYEEELDALIAGSLKIYTYNTTMADFLASVTSPEHLDEILQNSETAITPQFKQQIITAYTQTH